MSQTENHGMDSIKTKRKKIEKYIRINGYRLVFGIGSFLLIITGFLYWAGGKYNTPVLSVAMVFVALVLIITMFLSLIIVEAFVLKVKKYSGNQVTQTFDHLLKIERSKMNNKIK